MFEAVELGRRVGKAEYKARKKELRRGLVAAQFALQRARIPLLVMVEGIDSGSKAEIANLLQQWLDARGLMVHGFAARSEEERERPRLWRYWRALPARGAISLFAGSWYSEPLLRRALGKLTPADFDRHLHRIAHQERMLSLDGTLVLKFWMHLSRSAQRERFAQLMKDPSGARWILTRQDRQMQRHYRPLVTAAERMLRQTDLELAPWVVVEADDARYRDLMVGASLLAAMRQRLAELQALNSEFELEPEPEPPLSSPLSGEANANVLDRVDLTQSLDKAGYRKLLKKYQWRLTRLSWEAFHRHRSTVLVFEGWDAAGKGGVIRRLLPALDARLVRVIQTGAPSDEEAAHHYLWRFWRHLPRAGHMTIYDRSWYGRVLVERVEGFAREDEWRRAFSEINDFEAQLTEQGVLVLKFWLHIDRDEQLRRFEARERTPHKRYKITPEDYRNRERWPDYEAAVNDMVRHTSTRQAPWHLIAANDKHEARIQVLRQICRNLRQALARSSQS